MDVVQHVLSLRVIEALLKPLIKVCVLNRLAFQETTLMLHNDRIEGGWVAEMNQQTIE